MLIDKRFEKQNDFIKNLIIESETRILNEIDNRMSVFRNDIIDLTERVNKLETVADKINDIVNEISQLKSQKLHISDKTTREVEKLKNQFKKQENLNVACDLRINGVPYYEGENLIFIFDNICGWLNIQTPTVKSIYRINNNLNHSTNKDTCIMVNLISPYEKNFILKSIAIFKRSNKTNLLLNHIGFDSNKSFYVNENLTNENYIILQNALKLKRQKCLETAYSFRGLIYVKRIKSEPPILIENINQLSTFFQESLEQSEETANHHISYSNE